jgi:hypothetical protein
MSKNYTLVDPVLFLKEEDYAAKVKSLQENENEFPCIFFKINDGKFKNWFIQLTGVGLHDNQDEEETVALQCKYSVVKVPKSITDDVLDKEKPELDDLVVSILNEIITETNDLVGS